jgi:hypothetical protein
VEPFIEIVDGFRPWLARWDGINQKLFLASDVLRAVLPPSGGPEEVLLAWVHESLHARQPFAATAITEYRVSRGYEEGMVQGLAEGIIRHYCGQFPLSTSFAYYISVYQALASLLAVEAEMTWRKLWTWALGTLRAGRIEVVNELRPLNAAQRVQLVAVADIMFVSGRSDYAPSEASARQLWQRAFA